MDTLDPSSDDDINNDVNSLYIEYRVKKFMIKFDLSRRASREGQKPSHLSKEPKISV